MTPAFQASSALCPIYAGSERSRPELIGSGTLLDFGVARFLVTAAHVHDWYADASAELYTFGVVDGVERDVTIPQPFLKTALPSSGRREDDKIDFAFVRLTDLLADQIARIRYFLPFSLIDVEDRLSVGSRYMFTGYPISREKTDYGQKKVVPQAYSLTERTVGTSPMREFDFHPDTHIAVNYLRNAVKDENGNAAHFPLAKGMSGGPVWVGDGPSEEWLKSTGVRLVGIGIEDRVDAKMMVAVRIHLVTAAIGEKYPDLRNFAPRRRGFTYNFTFT